MKTKSYEEVELDTLERELSNETSTSLAFLSTITHLLEMIALKLVKSLTSAAWPLSTADRSADLRVADSMILTQWIEAQISGKDHQF